MEVIGKDVGCVIILPVALRRHFTGERHYPAKSFLSAVLRIDLSRGADFNLFEALRGIPFYRFYLFKSGI